MDWLIEIQFQLGLRPEMIPPLGERKVLGIGGNIRFYAIKEEEKYSATPFMDEA